MSDLWQKSICAGGLLHHFEIARNFEEGVTEICSHCKLRKFFKYKEPNRHYLSFHLKQALQPFQARFNREHKNYV